MGIGNISLPQILIILLIVLLIFGTKRIRNIGSDLGGAIREFRRGVRDEDDNEDDSKRESGDNKSTEKARKPSASDPDS
jgi:sec-independent protein translocase protein TatA